jgi:peptidoglycan/LPS O-acetylase OafA/YrhL
MPRATLAGVSGAADHGGEGMPGGRSPALDALRAMTMVLVVVEHAAVAYMVHPLPSLAWPVREPAGWVWSDLVFWLGRGFHVPLFFVVSGYFTALLTEKRGLAAAMRSRVVRLGVPLVGAVLLVLPVMYVIWSWGWVERGLCTWEDVIEARPPTMYEGLVGGPAHLWFLQFALVYTLAYGGARWLGLPARLTWARAVLSSQAGRALVLTACAGGVLVAHPGAMLDFHNDIVPHAAKLAYYGVFFVLGVVVRSSGLELMALTRGWKVDAAAAAACFGVAAWVVLGSWGSWETNLAMRTLTGVALAGYGVFSAFAWIGIFLRSFNRPSAAVAYTIDASYWIYLTHLPWIGVVAVVMMPMDAPAWAKFIAAIVVSFAMTLGSFALVRRTPLVGLLGARVKRTEVTR